MVRRSLSLVLAVAAVGVVVCAQVFAAVSSSDEEAAKAAATQRVAVKLEEIRP